MTRFSRRLLCAAAPLAALALALATFAAGCGGVGDAQSRLRTAVDAQKPSLDQCYGSALERDPTLAGELQLWVAVDDKGGDVDKVELSDSSISDPSLQQCVESTLVGVKIEPSPKANLKVQYTLQFTPAT